MDPSIVIPITFWSHSQPTFRISSICITPNCEKLVTGSYTGQLCIWDLNLNAAQITPKNILIGHKQSVNCVVSTNEFAISSCEGGELCRWNLDDGYCTKTNKSLFVHRHMQLYRQPDEKDELLFTCGDYSEIFIIHPFTLQVIFVLYSKKEFNWISNFHVILSKNTKCDIVSGITTNGCAKMWVIEGVMRDSQSFEVHSKPLQINNVVDIKYNSSQTDLLIVSIKDWTLFDLDFSNYKYRVEAHAEERLLGGNFCDSNVVVWSNSGKFYIYNVSETKHELICKLLDDGIKITLFDPQMSLLQTAENENYVIRGDSQGKINIWKIDLHNKESKPLLSTNLKDNWIASGSNFLYSFVQCSSVTCCIYVLGLDKFFVGCYNGTIVSIPAVQSVMSFYFHSSVKKPPVDVLLGHNGKINCLLYPHEVYSYFNICHLVSGGSDFSVCLWDIFKCELLYRFCVQSGEILKLTLLPAECNAHVKQSICSVSSDHSVAVLNLKNRRCVILTSRHEFPVVKVHWKPLDDFIIVECFDGTVYVWQMETGHLDRVLDGVTAQEVVYGCEEPEPTMSVWNFYIREHLAKNSIKREIFQVEEDVEKAEVPFALNGFLTSQKFESHIFACNIKNLIAQISSTVDPKQEILDCAISRKIYLLTQALNADLSKGFSFLEKNKQEAESFHEKFQYQRNAKIRAIAESNGRQIKDSKSSFFISDALLRMVKFFLSSLHIWGLNPSLDDLISTRLELFKPDILPPVGILSRSGVYSLFLPAGDSTCRKSSVVLASTCIAMVVLAKALESSCNPLNQEKLSQVNSKKWWGELLLFYELICSNPNHELDIPRPKIEILARVWQTKCYTLRSIVRKLLSNYLQALGPKENIDLLEFWYKYLPHFKIIDKTSSEKIDFENVDLKSVALVLFGIVGSDLKFKASDSESQENYIYQTCASFVYLMLLPKGQKIRFEVLQAMAVDFLGRGYIVWEQFLKMEKIIPMLFQMCGNFSKLSLGSADGLAPQDKCLTVHEALKSIAIARTAAFIKCLLNEITKIKSGASQTSRNGNFLLEHSKAEILSVLTFLLEKTPYIMLLYMNDVISIFVYCIDFSHLKQDNLSNLIPAMQKFRQVHHSVSSQKIAVGLATGSLVVHDLKTGKSHEISAHKDSVSALKFSEDGKTLVSYSCYENRISFWHILTGIFGLGQVQVKCIKSCQTYRIHDEEIRNHLEIASLSWADKKSVVLTLCDGTEAIFHS